MMRVVLDTNVLVSGMLGFTRDESVPGGLLRRWREDAYQLVISRHILTELNRSLNDNWFQERIAPRLSLAAINAFQFSTRVPS
jgi:predicted nucleic acid-binding protein